MKTLPALAFAVSTAALLAGCAVDAPSQPAPPAAPVASAGEACRAAIASRLQIGMGETWVIESTMGETSTRVLVGASTAEAPWACDWGGPNAGVVRVEYTAQG
jgi:uncharacterized lipoprotein YbaY